MYDVVLGDTLQDEVHLGRPTHIAAVVIIVLNGQWCCCLVALSCPTLLRPCGL